MWSNPWQIVFHNAKGVPFVNVGYNSPNCDSCCYVVIINQHTHVTITNMQSHHS